LIISLPCRPKIKDSTLEHTGSNLASECHSSRDKRRDMDDASRDHMRVTDYNNKPTFLDSYDKALVSRVHTQITHTYTGHLLHHFKDLKELLQVILHVVEGEPPSTHWLEFSNNK
jgi:hypothetical protein